MWFCGYVVMMVVLLVVFKRHNSLETTASDRFYFSFPLNLMETDDNVLQLFVHTQDPIATFNITSLDQEFNYSGNCSFLNPAIVDVPPAYAVSNSESRLKGMRIVADRKVSVLGLSSSPPTSASVSSLYSCDGTPDQVSSYVYNTVSVSLNQVLGLDNYPSQILIVGCHDNSNITIIPSQSIAAIPEDPQNSNSSSIGLAAGESHNIVLHSMQTLLFTSELDLTASKILSDKPLTVISGNQCARIREVGGGTSCDFLMVQVPPTIQWGNTFLLSPHKGRPEVGQGYKIINDGNNEASFIVTVTCAGSEVSEHPLSPFDQQVVFYTEGETYCSVMSDHPIHVVQLGVSRGIIDTAIGDPTINNVSPVGQYHNAVQFTAIQSFESYYSVVIQNDEFFNGSILIDGTLQTISSWTAINNSNGSVVGYGYLSEMFDGTHTIAHPNKDGTLFVTVFGWDPRQGYSYSAGLSESTTFEEIEVSVSSESSSESHEDPTLHITSTASIISSLTTSDLLPSSKDSSGLSSSAVAGIAVAMAIIVAISVIIAVLVITILVYLYCCRRTNDKSGAPAQEFEAVLVKT